MTQQFNGPINITGDWTGVVGALELTADKPTMKLTGGAIAGNEKWVVQVGSDGPGNLQFFKQQPGGQSLQQAAQQPGQGSDHWEHVMSLTSSGRVGVGIPLPRAQAEIVGDWNGVEGALRLTGDKPTMKLAGGAIAGNETWIVQVGSDGPGNLQFFKQQPGQAPNHWELVMELTPAGAVRVTGDLNVRGVSLPQQIGALDLQLNSLKSAIDGISNKLTGINARLATLESRVNALPALEGRVGTLEGRVGALEARVTASGH